jgi:hypothetical protein
MPLSKIEFQPGINKEATDYSAQGGWVDGNLIRFRKARVEKIGGWLQLGQNYYLGLARAMHSWISLGGTRFLGIGSTWKYYIEEGDAYYDVTPVRLVTSAGDVTFAATDGSSTLTITDTAHGAVNNDFVTFSGAATLGGLVTAEVLNQEYQIVLTIDANTYTIIAKDTSGAVVTANSSDSGNSGGSTVGTYQINVGLDTYVTSTGWGVNTWGAGTFGSASAISAVNQLRLWTNDNFGENLVINPRGAGIYRWKENDGVSVIAKELSGLAGANQVPTVGLQVITSETDRHLVVLGSDPLSGGVRTGIIDPMLVAFSEAENELEFEALATNSAGDVRLSSGSFIVGGMKSRQEILIWTDTSLYRHPNGVYFASKTGFYIYTGAVKKLPCSVQEYVFEDLDLSQAFKCHMGLNSEFGEMWFYYPSKEDATGEISRYVIYNYEENTWSIGSLVRYSWLDAGIEDLPLSAAQESGQSLIYTHETGYNNNQTAMTNVFIESGDTAIGDGDSFSFVKQIIPDVAFISDGSESNTPAMNIVVKRRDYPGQSLTTDSTTQVTGTSTYSNIRSRARQLVFRFESDDDAAAANQVGYKWRLGSTRIEIQPSGRRS